MSVHTERAFTVARTKGAAAGRNYSQWRKLASLPKRELIEVALHLAALCTDSYDAAIQDNEAEGAFRRVMEEHAALRANGII